MKKKSLLLLAALSSTVLASAQELNVELNVGGNIDKTVFNQLDSFAVNYNLNLKDAVILASTVKGVDYPADEIPDSAFLTHGYVNPNGVWVWSSNKNVQSVVLPASIKSIGNSAFSGIAATAIDFSACTQLQTIESDAFDLANVEKIDLTGLNALKTISRYAFNQTHATSITLDGCSSLETIEERAFCQSYLVTAVSFKGLTALKFIGNRAFLNLGKNSGDCGEIDLTPCTALETIDESAFQSAKTTSVKLPASLKAINKAGFNLASNITTITFEGAVPPELGVNAFTAKVMSSAKVYVPAGSEQAYKDAGFENVESITSGVRSVRAELSDAPAYDLNGRQVTDSSKGLLIQEGRKLLNK